MPSSIQNTNYFIPILPRPSGQSASATPQQADAPQNFPLSPAFRKAGVRQIGEWLPVKSGDLPKERQQMVTSMLAHLKNRQAGEAVVCEGDRILFNFKHPQESETDPACKSKMAVGSLLGNARYLDGVLTLTKGEVTAISITDPWIATGDKEVVKLEKPERKRLRSLSPSEQRLRKQVPAQSGQGGKSVTKNPPSLDTPYSDIALTPHAQEVLSENAATSAQFYHALWKSNREKKKNAEEDIGKVLSGFDDFLLKMEKSLPDVMANFGEFAQAAAAYEEMHADVSGNDVPDIGVWRQVVRNVLYSLSEWSFERSPLEYHVHARMKDSRSPFQELRQNEERPSFMKSHTYLVNLYFVAQGKRSIAEALQPSAGKEFVEAGREIVKRFPNNHRLQNFVRVLRRDTYPLQLDTMFCEAIDKVVESRRRDPDLKKKFSESTVQAYKKVAYRLAEYAYVHDKSDELLRFLEKFPWRDKSSSDARKEAQNACLPILKWAGGRKGEFQGAVGALAEGLWLTRGSQQSAHGA